METPLTTRLKADFTSQEKAELQTAIKHIDLIMEHLGLTYDDSPRLIAPESVGPPPLHGTDTAAN